MLQIPSKESQEIYVEIPEAAKSINLQPGKKNASFQVKVRNNSAVYASFQLQIDFYDRIGNNPIQTGIEWYRISPEIGTLKPPGAWTTFNVEITKAPIPGFVGNMDLIITVSSDEIAYQPRTILKNIQVEQGVYDALVLDLPVSQFKVYPGDVVEIPVYIYNPNYLAHKGIQVKFKTNNDSQELQLDLRWLDAIIKPNFPVEIRPNYKEKIIFVCQIPNGLYNGSGVYYFTIEALDQQSKMIPSVTGNIEVLPLGDLNLQVNPSVQEIVPQPSWKFWRSDPVSYEIQLQNNSNVNQVVNFEISGNDQEKCGLEINNIELESFTEKVNPLENSAMSLTVNSPRPWVGLTKELLLPLKVIWSKYRYLTNQNDSENLRLILKPIIPLWLQVLGGFLFLWLVWLFSPFNPSNAKHQNSVNSVEFNGVGDTLISGSSDQTVIAWNVAGFSSWKPLTKPKIKGFETGDTAKAVRVVSYRPVDNNMMAIGLENGEIQIWDLLASENKPKYSFFFQKDDRVLGLEFTQNSRYLFSGHGSGLVLQWDLRKLDAPKFEPVGQLPLNFTASSLAFLGKDDRNLVIAGRYNRMVIWNGTTNQLRLISYPQEGSQNDYIESLDTVISNPSFLVTGDNQGYITLWNVGDCLTENNQKCGQVLDRWNTGHQEKPVRSVALSDDGCYLVSGGDDGRVMLWPLTQLGKRATEFLDGKPVEGLSLSQGFNDVDLKIVKNRLLIASGNKDHRVRVKWEKRQPQVGCDR